MAESAAKSWCLYLLECEDGSLYCGITNDLPRRFAVHQAGKGAKYTRSRKPRRIAAMQAHPDRSSALRAEYALKQLDLAGKRAFVPANPNAGSTATTRRRAGRRRRH
jgi:putative endonuclease